MRKILIFTKREYLAAVRTKGFIIGLIIAPIMMSGGAIAFWLLKDRVDINDKRVSIIDHTGQVAEAIITAAEERNAKDLFDAGGKKQIRPAYYFNLINANTEDPEGQRLELSDQVRSGALHAFVEIGKDVIHPVEDSDQNQVLYYAKNAAMDDVREWFRWPLNDRLRKLRLEDAGIPESSVSDLFDWINVGGMGLLNRDVSGGIEGAREASPIEALLVPIALMMLMFLMIMMSVPAMLNSVMEEKTQRIAEVVLGSVTPFQFMMAKLLGGIAVSLTISAVYIIGGLYAVSFMDVMHYIPLHVLPWFFVFMLLAVVMFGAFSSALGSTCSEPKDAQSLSFPAILMALIPMFIYLPVAKEPLGSFATWTSLIPPFTPMLMLLRMATPESIPAWQPWVGLFGVILFTFLFVWIGGRIFRVAILMQGTPPTLANMVRWAIRG